jgi:hypothetical protein
MARHWLVHLSTGALFFLAVNAVAQVRHPSADECTCPYLKQQGAANENPPHSDQALPHGVLENLERLEAAQGFLSLADYFEHSCFPSVAEGLYEQVQQLCPGSQPAREASDRLKKMGNANRSPVKQQPNDETKWLHLINHCLPSGSVLGLYPAGMMIPDIAGTVTITKPWENAAGIRPVTNPPEFEAYFHAIGLGSRPINISDRKSTCPPPAVPELLHVGKETEIQPNEEQPDPGPDLPPVDPKIVDALEKILAEAADPLPAKLVILDSAHYLGDHQAEPVSEWPCGPSPVKMPSMLAEPENPDAALEDDDDSREAVPDDFDELFREALESLRSHAWIDIDSSREDGLRAECELQIGGIDLKLIRNEPGQCWAVIKLLPEACPDLRAAQRAHNDSMIDWIVSLSGNPEAETVSSESEPEITDTPSDADDDMLREN